MSVPLAIAIGLVLLFGVVGSVIYLTFRRMQDSAVAAQERQKQHAEREARAVYAQATVINIRNTPHLAQPGASNRLRVELRLEVQPPGSEKYQANASWLVEDYAINQIQPGASLSVKIDQQDPKIVYPNMNGAKYNPRT